MSALAGERAQGDLTLHNWSICARFLGFTAAEMRSIIVWYAGRLVPLVVCDNDAARFTICATFKATFSGN